MRNSSPTELYDRLLALCEVFRAAGHSSCSVRLDAKHTRFDEEVSEIVYSTIRELLANVLQHAHATRVEVSSLRRRDGSIGIVVADNGVGLPPHRRRGSPFDEKHGIGLWTIDRRLRECDGMLDIEAAPGKGTRAMIILPTHRVLGD
jgi:signal transduction histidine kinase